MGTYYGVGVIRGFEVHALFSSYSQAEWEELLTKRIDLSLFDVKYEEKTARGKIKEQLFSNHIENLYKYLVDIVDQEHIGYYFQQYGNDLDEYGHWKTTYFMKGKKDEEIQFHVDLAILYTEGKVFAEEFYIEPFLINWLFKNSNIKNPLAGCIMSTIVG